MNKAALNVLLDFLVDTDFDTPCNFMLDVDWCEKHCKAGQTIKEMLEEIRKDKGKGR